MDELDVCPFCGSAHLEPDWTCALVRCRICGAEGPVVGWAETSEARRADAVAAWNRRATPPDDLRAELVALLRAEVALDEWRKARNTPESATALRKALEAAGWDGGDFNEVAWWLRDRRAAVLAKVDAAGEGRGT